MEIAALIITSVISGIAIIVSAISLLVAKRQVITSVITNNRINWIEAVRTQLMEFLAEYLGQDDKRKLRIIKSKIEMHIRNDANIYKPLVTLLNKCIDAPYNESDYQAFVAEAQSLLNKIWHRTKREAGIKRKEEKRLKTDLKTEFTKK